MTEMRHTPELEPPHSASQTANAIAELQLYGYRPYQDEPDPRPLPEGPQIAGAVADIFDALIVTLEDTRLEPDLEELLWASVNLFHRANARIERNLDDNEQAQKRGQQEQDGSEVKSVELERSIAEGQSLLERRSCMELFRDTAADLFERHTGTPWRPRSGSMVSQHHYRSRPYRAEHTARATPAQIAQILKRRNRGHDGQRKDRKPKRDKTQRYGQRNSKQDEIHEEASCRVMIGKNTSGGTCDISACDKMG